MRTIILLIVLILYGPFEYAQLLPWKKIIGNPTPIFTAITTDPTSNTLYIANNGQLIRTTDLGITLSSVLNPLLQTETLLSLGGGIIFGGYGGSLGVLRSTDNGETWSNIYPIWQITELSYDGKRIWGGNENGQIIYSSDVGNTWTLLNFSTDDEIISIRSDSPYVFIGTSFGGYFRSTDYGQSWNRIPNLSGPGYICEGNEKTNWLISNDSLFYSYDNGSTWNFGSSLSMPTYLAIDDFDNLYYSSSWEGLYKSSDDGISWDLISVFRPEKISFIDSTIFLMNAFEVLVYDPSYKHVPGKNMWPLANGNKYQYYSYSTNPFGWSYQLEAKNIIMDTLINDKRYFAFDSSGNFFRYENDSNKAFLWYNGVEGLYCDFNLLDGSTFSQFSPFFHTYTDVTVSIDSQAIWGVNRKTFLVETARGYDLIYEKFAEHLGIIKKGSGSFGPGPDSETDSWLVNTLLHDSSGDYEYFPNGYLPEITFTPFASIGDSTFITFDIEVNHNYNRTSSSFGILRDGIVYIDSVFVEFNYKKDSIKTSLCRIEAQRIPVTNSYKIVLPVDTFLIRSGYDLLYRIGAKDRSIIPIYSYSPDSGYYQAVYLPTSIEDESSRIKTFSLSQNYPNPFNPTTKITYAIPLLGGDERGGLVTLKVYDILGNEVATLVNEYKPAGTYEVEFNSVGTRHASSTTNVLPSGVYFYQLKVRDYIETKKMILLR